MAFLLAKMEVGHTPPIQYLPMKAGEAAALGEALAVADGALTKCGPTARPGYIAVGLKQDDGCIPAVAVQGYMTFAAPLSAKGTDLKVGEKVTLHTDGLQVTATTASGVAEIVRIESREIGGCVHVKF